MLVKVKTMVGKEVEFDITGAEKVFILKGKIAEKVGIPEPQQKLVCNGKPMIEDKTFNDQNIKAGSVIQLALVLRGG
jgi:ubiquitin-like protein Nedd8